MRPFFSLESKAAGEPRSGHIGGSILIYGGLARDCPYPGSTTVTTVNGGVTSLVRTLVVELAPTRVNALHPAIVGASASPSCYTLVTDSV